MGHSYAQIAGLPIPPPPSAFERQSQAVKQTHAALSQKPGFRDQPPAKQFKQTQQAIRQGKR